MGINLQLSTIIFLCTLYIIRVLYNETHKYLIIFYYLAYNRNPAGSYKQCNNNNNNILLTIFLDYFLTVYSLFIFINV